MHGLHAWVVLHFVPSSSPLAQATEKPYIFLGRLEKFHLTWLAEQQRFIFEMKGQTSFVNTCSLHFSWLLSNTSISQTTDKLEKLGNTNSFTNLIENESVDILLTLNILTLLLPRYAGTGKYLEVQCLNQTNPEYSGMCEILKYLIKCYVKIKINLIGTN